MKIAMFREPKSYIEWMQNEAEAIRNHGLRFAEQELADAISGKSKEAWFRMNTGIAPEDQNFAWDGYIKWLTGRVKSLKRKIRKYEKEIEKVKIEYNIP